MPIEFDSIRIEVPESTLSEGDPARLGRYLTEDGTLDEAQARALVEEILSEAAMALGDGYLERMASYAREIESFRTELRARTTELLTELRRGTRPDKLPPRLTAEAFRALFRALESTIDELRPPEEAGAGVHDAVITPDEVSAAIATGGEAEQAPPTRAPRPAWRTHPSEVGLPPEELPLPPEEVGVGVTPEEIERYMYGEEEGAGEGVAADLPLEEERPERRPSVAEQQRAERLRYRERGQEDLRVRRQAAASLRRFAQRTGIEAAGWRVWVERTPRYGATEAQLRAFAGVDPEFSGRGYGVAFRSPRGVIYRPDAVVPVPGGTRFTLGEYKWPLGEQPQSFYNSEAGRQKLSEDLFERALMSRELPNCAGWTYDTGAPWLDDLILELRQNLGRGLAERILVPKGKGP